jgi:uncharacterized protein DUF222
MTGVSPRWEAVPPSGRLADMFAGTDLSAHSDDGVLSVIAAAEKAMSWLQAVQLRALAEFDRRRPADEFAGEEVAGVLTLSPRTGVNRLDWAIEVARRLPRTLAAMEAGAISYAQLRVIAEETLHLAVEDVPAVEERVLAGVADKTPGQVRRMTKRAVLAVDTDAAIRRAERARTERKVVVNPLPDGMAEFVATLPAPDAQALYSRLDELARNAVDSRSMDQRRADALTEIVRGSAGPAGKPLVHVIIDESTLAGRDDAPAELVGYGPITAPTAREVAADGIWQALRTDRAGVATDIGSHRYRPGPVLAEFIRIRDRRCRHRGCQQPAHRADLDHTVPFPEGPTTPDNLTALCRRHHRMKHGDNGWKVTHKSGVALEWTSPTGRKYETRPSPL